MERDDNQPVYTIGIIAKLLNVCPATLRIWEKKDLIKPARIGKNRFYSECDLDRLKYMQRLLQKGINIEGVKNILDTARCWDVKNCKPQIREDCSVYIKYGHS